MIDILGDSWWIVLALIVITTGAVLIDIAFAPAAPVVTDDSQSHRDANLFEQIEEFRRDFS